MLPSPRAPLRPVLFAATLAVAASLGGPGLAAAAPNAAEPADGRKLPAVAPTRVAQIAAWLSARPAHFTPGFDDRSFWAPLAALPAADRIAAEARRFAGQPIPALPDSLYSEYRDSGHRESYELPFNRRTERLVAFMFAEGLSDTGRWLAPIEAELAAILDEPSWAVPAHASRSRKTRADACDYVDLAAAARAWTLATADWLLGDRLRPSTRERIRREIRARVLSPWLERVHSGDPRDFWWMTAGHNWNAVCNTGVTGTALLLAESPAERAEFIAAYEALTPFFIKGFADDGFCHEGIGYWVYGFGHYLAGGELIRIATAGRVDLLAAPKIARIAAFARNWEIAGGLYAAFGDARLGSVVPSWMAAFVAARFAAAPPSFDAFQFQQRHSLGAQPYATLLGLAHRSHESGAAPAGQSAPRGWFPDGGALVARSLPPDAGLSVALKGGHNGQPHNHNDLGSFVVVRDGVLVMSDPGVDVYTKDTFGPLRYTSGVMNSFGHPVPRVAGQLQKTGADARAVTVRAEFTDERDLWELDLSSAYDVPGLERLTRTFTFTRSGGGKLEIVDRVRFASPQTFGTAVILLPGQRREAARPDGFRLETGGKAVDVAFQAVGDELVLNEEPVLGIVPDSPPRGTRVGLDLRQPAREAEIRLVITPAAFGSHP